MVVVTRKKISSKKAISAVELELNDGVLRAIGIDFIF